MLVSALLLFLGIPIWMLFGAIILIFWNRRKVKSQSGMFVVKFRAIPDNKDDQSKWSKKGYAQWVHDVLIVRTGVGLMKSTPYGVMKVKSFAKKDSSQKVKGLGDNPVFASVQLDDNSILQVALDKKHPEFAPMKFN